MNPVKYLYQTQILEKHIDLFGHVNNAVYLQFLEEARWDLIAFNGFNGFKIVEETSVGPIILEANLKFKKELRLEQKISIETQFFSYHSRIARLHQEIKCSASSTTHCVAEFKFALFHTLHRKLVLPSDLWLKALGLSWPFQCS